MSDTMKFEVIPAAPERLVRSPSRSYRHWSEEEKVRIVGETFAPSANVSAIARAHEMDPSQLFTWRRKALASGVVAPLAETAAFSQARLPPHCSDRFIWRGWIL